MRLTALFRDFLQSEKVSGILLFTCTIISLLIANSGVGHAYINFWGYKTGFSIGNLDFHLSIADWINDGLMTIFFLMVGLEIERELYIGELSDRKRALLPVIGALGGMIAPALIYWGFNKGTETISGIGIPTATDIAFAIAIMGFVSDRVPLSIKVFLTALAIIDDLGAILVIALFYGHGFSALYLGIALGILGFLFFLAKRGVTTLWIYLPAGIVAWIFMMHSGIHATITGVLLAFVIPFEKGTKSSVSYKLQHALHQPVAFIIIPLFALANTALILKSEMLQELGNAESMGIFFGLLLGKPLGITLFAYGSVAFGITKFGRGVKFAHIFGAGMLAGIGFTMSIFITNLAFTNDSWIQLGKISILLGSAAAAILGLLFLRIFTPKPKNVAEI
ncbi:MAG: Na+/H+ antiporter NhaA [Bacteroidetes bacterium]|nr:Na+/H+ antiporter NhaA [Bacteroidota bacterium]